MLNQKLEAVSTRVQMHFDRLQDEFEHVHLKQLPTSFYLEANDVDRLKAAARKILTHSVKIDSFVDDMQ